MLQDLVGAMLRLVLSRQGISIPSDGEFCRHPRTQTREVHRVCTKTWRDKQLVGHVDSDEEALVPRQVLRFDRCVGGVQLACLLVLRVGVGEGEGAPAMSEIHDPQVVRLPLLPDCEFTESRSTGVAGDADLDIPTAVSGYRPPLIGGRVPRDQG